MRTCKITVLNTRNRRVPTCGSRLLYIMNSAFIYTRKCEGRQNYSIKYAYLIVTVRYYIVYNNTSVHVRPSKPRCV